MDEPRPDDAPSEQPEQTPQPDPPAQPDPATAQPDPAAAQPEPAAQEPIDISADVDALLNEAAALAGQIAEDTGAQVDADAAPSLAEADALAADPKDAVDDVEKKLAELEALVGVTTQDGEADGDDSGFVTEAGDEDGTSSAGDGKATDAKSHDTARAAKAKPGAKADAKPGYDFDTSLVGDIEVNLDESIVNEPEDFGLDAGAKTAVAALRGPIEKLLAIPKTIGDAFKRFFSKGLFRRIGDTLIFRAILAGLELIDGPFAGLSPAAKRNIGIIAIITVLTGIASWFLPSLFNSNPYLDMAMNP